MPYTETFETTSPKLGCWLVSGDAAWGIGTGDYSTATGSFEGSYNAKITHSSNGNVSKLISPVLGTNNGVILHFAYVMRSWGGDVDELRVYSRTSENAAWQQVAEYTDAAASWTVANVVVPGSVYQIAFEMTDNYGYGVGLDSVVFAPMAADFCPPVIALAASNITTTGATLSWTGDANSYTITGLTGLRTYEIQVQANCGGGNVSDWSASITATTTNVGIEEFLAGSVSLYPNPAREYVDIRIDGDVNVSMMEVFDVFGKLISTVNVVDNPTRINVSGLADGMYFVRVTTEQGIVTKTFVKK